MEEVICVSPNGGDVSQGRAAARLLFVSSIDGVVRLERTSSGSWRETGRSLSGVHVGSLFYEPVSKGLFAGAHSGGLFVSFDLGQSWERRTEGLTQPHVYTIAGREEDGITTLYVGTEPAHLFRSVDLGKHWRELPAIRAIEGVERWMFPAPPYLGHVKQIAFHPKHKDTMLVCVEQGALLRTTDRGMSWTELDAFHAPERHKCYKDVHRLRISPANPHLMYMTGGDGFFRTEDAGETWAELTDSSRRVKYPDALHLSPGDDRTLFMAGAGSDPATWPERQTADASIMRSDDGGGTWQQLTNGLPQSLHGHVAALSMHVSDSAFELFAGTGDGELFASYDGGQHWQIIGDRLPAVSKGNHHMRLPQRRLL